MGLKEQPSGNKEKTFHLPIEITVYVPSTNKQQKFIGSQQFKKRISLVKSTLSRIFGGYTRISGEGGFTLSSGKLAEEKVAKVTSFTKRGDYFKSRSKLLNFLHRIKRTWGQESIGLIVENDLHYVS